MRANGQDAIKEAAAWRLTLSLPVEETLITGFQDGAPLLRWAGSKKKLLPVLLQAAPKDALRYVEPFAGSAVLFLKLMPEAAVLADINPDLIQTYEVVRKSPRRVWRIANSCGTDEASYYQVRALNPKCLTTVERAARFVYLNRFCFNGVYRTNRQGEFNVSRGRGHLGIPPLRVFHEFADRLNRVDLHVADFETTLGMARCGDFAYLDPPYASTGNRDRGEYGTGSFKNDDVLRLANALQGASDRGVKVLLSYTDHRKLLNQLPGWHIKRLTVGRNVAGFSGSRRQAREVLVSNYKW